jgi:hypothetical protein
MLARLADAFFLVATAVLGILILIVIVLVR